METREEVTTVLLGRNTVKEALKSGREIDAIYLTEAAEANAKDIVALAKRAGVPIKRASKAKLDEMSQFAAQGQKASNHQGILAKAAAVRYRTLEDAQVLAEQRGEPLFLIALDGIEDPHNLGAIVRSAEVFGAHGVVIPKRRSVGMTAAAAKTASGAEEYMPVIRVTNLPSFIDQVKELGVFVAVAPGHAQRPAADHHLRPNHQALLDAALEGDGGIAAKAEITDKGDALPQHVADVFYAVEQHVLLGVGHKFFGAHRNGEISGMIAQNLAVYMVV